MYKKCIKFTFLPFTDIVIIHNNLSKKIINKLTIKFNNIEFINYEKENFSEICKKLDDKITPLYIGDNKDIIELKKIQSGYTLMFGNTKNSNYPSADFIVGMQEFINILIEVNNLYL